MSNYQAQDNQHHAIAQSLLLIVCIPLVFYGGYRLVSSSSTEQLDADLPIVKKAKQLAPHLGKLGNNDPPPGEGWLAHLGKLETAMNATRATTPAEVTEETRLNASLAAVRKHIEEHINDVPQEISNSTPLGKMLSRISNQIQNAKSTESPIPLRINLNLEFEKREMQRDREFQTRVAAIVDREIVTLNSSYQARLNELTMKNRALANDLERFRNQSSSIQRGTREAVATEQREQAFLRDQAEIERLLKPFITPGYYQLRGDRERWRKTAEKKPLSFKQLEELGALASDISGLRNLAVIGGLPATSYPNAARPLGSFPQYFASTLSSPHNIEKIKRAQHLLRNHSVYLIENGYLQP